MTIVNAHKEGAVPSASETAPSLPEPTQGGNPVQFVVKNSRMTPEAQAQLREPFPPEAIGKLPRGGVRLDYVGHAAVTDRLLAVDPAWSWNPLAYDANGAPLIVERNGMLEMWVELTVCGVTRLGVGTVQKAKPEAAKELIGDALRNAAMRFGVAIDLWSKEDLQAFKDAESAPTNRPPNPMDSDTPLVGATKQEPSAELATLLAKSVPSVDEGPFALMEFLTDLEALMVTEGFWPKDLIAKAARSRKTTLEDLSESVTELHDFITAAFDKAKTKVGE
jgi:hypothetical protein